MMSKMPKWMANAMESLLKSLYFECKIVAIEPLNSELLKIEFESLTTMPNCKFGDAISIRVSDTEFRNFTAVSLKDRSDCFYILFHMHGGTLGNEYIEQLKIGDRLKMVIPRGRSPLQGEADIHVVVTDETGLGFAINMIEEYETSQQQCYVISENDALNTSIVTELFKRVISVRKGQVEQGINLFFEQYFLGAAKIHFYLIGNAKTIQQAMILLKQKGISSHDIFSQPFWALGKKGL